jgi:hypothetical protein
MHVKSKIKDLSLVQWDYVQQNLMTSYEMGPLEVRVDAEFELTADFHTRRVEMPVATFAGLLTVLRGIDLAQAEVSMAQVVEAVLTPDALPDSEAGQEPLPGPVHHTLESLSGYPDKAADPSMSYDESPGSIRCEHHNPPHLYDCRANWQDGPMEPGGMFGDGIK